MPDVWEHVEVSVLCAVCVDDAGVALLRAGVEWQRCQMEAALAGRLFDRLVKDDD